LFATVVMLLKKNWQPHSRLWWATSFGNNPRFVSKVISNYTNHIANTPVDGAFKNSLGKNNQIKNGSQTAI
jgi:hypothetical protein